MASTRSVKSPGIFASAANTVIPPTPIQGVSYRDPVAGPASTPEGWPFFEKVNSAEFNQIMFQYGTLLDTLDKKGILGWTNLVDYTVPAIVMGSNGLIYFAIQASGPATSVQDPISAPTYWQQLAQRGSVSFIAAGVTSWTVPLAMQLGYIKPRVTVIGGGGGASRISATATGGGGGGGGAAVEVVDLTGVTSVSITVGVGGTGKDGSSFGDGAPGGTSSFGAFLSATGGSAGILAGTRVAGGTGSGGDMNWTGQQGASSLGGGAGGNSPFFPGGQTGGATATTAFTGANGVGPGGGGGGGNPNSTGGAGAGGNGAPGAVLIEW